MEIEPPTLEPERLKPFTLTISNFGENVEQTQPSFLARMKNSTTTLEKVPVVSYITKYTPNL